MKKTKFLLYGSVLSSDISVLDKIKKGLWGTSPWLLILQSVKLYRGDLKVFIVLLLLLILNTASNESF